MAGYVVGYHPKAVDELERLPRDERLAMLHAVEKLTALGPALPFPHQSKVMGARDLRELRPRAGRSSWRALYRRIAGDTFVVAALGPEAKHDPRRFQRAVTAAQARLEEIGTGDQ